MILNSMVSVATKDSLEQEREIINQINLSSQANANSKLLNSFLGFHLAHKLKNPQDEFLNYKIIETNSDKKISLKSETVNSDNFNLNFSFDYFWQLKNIVISGAGNLNEDLQLLYKRYCPEKFNLENHYLLIEKLKQKLATHGFFSPEINDNFELNFASKTVLVKLDIKLSKPLFVETVKIQTSGAIDPKIEQLKPKIIKLCKKNILNKRYELALVNICLTKIQDLLLFNDVKNLQVDLQYNKSKKTLTIYLNATEDLLSTINASKQFLSDPSYQIQPDILAEIIKRDCLKRGFCQAQIKQNEEEFYSFTPSHPIIIKEIDFLDLDPENESDLEISLPKIEQQVFNKATLDLATNVITKEYLRAGFWNCQVYPKITMLKAEPQQASICFSIQKGKCHIINQFKITQFNNAENKRVQQITSSTVKLKTGNPANPYLIEKYKNQIEERLKEEGFFKSKVTINIATSNDDEIIATDIFYNVEPGQKARFGEILLDNTSKIPTKKIRKKLSFSTGEEWNLSKVKTSLKKIEAMHLFKDVRFSSVLQPEDSDDLTIPIRLTITQDKPREFKAHVGGSIFGIGIKREPDEVGFSCHLGGSYIVKNPFMLADHVQIGAAITQNKQTAELMYKCFEPFEIPFESQIKLFVGRCGLKDGFAIKQKIHNDFVSRAGVSLSLFSESERFGMLQLSSGFELICPPSLKRKNPENWSTYFAIGPAYNLDKIYSSWFNRLGNSLSLSAQLIVPMFKNGCFLHTAFKDSVFIPFGSNACLAFVFGLENNQALSQAVYPVGLGASHNEFSKKNPIFFPSLTDRYDLPAPERLAWEVLEQGSSRVLEIMSELRVKVFGPLAAVAFQGLRYIDKVGILHASGFGLRYMTPFGMICVDLAAKWNFKKSFKDTCSWRVSLGQAF